jgi:membrane associated rhomboid family serine protease
MSVLGRASNSLAWWLVCAVAVAGSALVWLLPMELQEALRWRVDRGHAIWTYWTAALTHLSASHLLLNALSMVLLAALGALLGAGRREALALLMAWPLTHMGLWAWPDVTGYAGLSGVSHAAAGVIVARGVRLVGATGQWQSVAWGLGLLMAGKLLWEAGWSAPIRLDISWGFAVIQAAHLSGFAAGLLTGLILPLESIKRLQQRR